MTSINKSALSGHDQLFRGEGNAGRALTKANRLRDTLRFGRGDVLKKFIAALALVSAPVSAQLTVDQVVLLHEAGIADEAIVAKVRSSGARFDLSPEQMIALKAQGVSGQVMAAMLTTGSGPATMSPSSADPMLPHPTGVYLLDDSRPQTQMRRIDPILSSQAKTGGIIGSAMTLGIASASIKVALAGETSNTRTASKRPTFYFFFDESNPGIIAPSAFKSEMGPDVMSPREFVLAKLMEKDSRREARVGSINIAGAKTGVMDKDRTIFIFDKVRPGVFKVYPQIPLEPGEYGFIMPILGGAMGAGSTMARIFDFTVS